MRSPTTFGAQSFNGFAVYTEEKKFQKVQLTDVDKGKADFLKQASDGWLAYVQHYFVAGWLPPAKVAREYAMREARRRRLCRPCADLRRHDRARRAARRSSVPLYAGSAGAEPPGRGRARVSTWWSTTAGSRSSPGRCSGCWRSSTA